MTNPKLISGHFEAKKHGYRQTQDGCVVSFVVHPNDISPEFAAAPLGTILQVAYQEYDPDAKEAPKAEKPKKRFEDMKPSQQAALLCKDAEFREFLQIDNAANDEAAEAIAARKVRNICGVSTRADLCAGGSWTGLLNDFRAFQTENRYRNTPAMEKG